MTFLKNHGRNATLAALVGALMLGTASMWAERLTSSEAMARTGSSDLIPVTTPMMKAKAGEDGMQDYYLFRVGATDEYVIASAESRLPAVLARYSAPADTPVPPAMEELMRQYSVAISSITPTTRLVRYQQNLSEIAPLLTTTLGQGFPYNVNCPNISGIRTLTGCVATAMAQIINHTHFVNATTNPIPAYTTASSGIALEELPVRDFAWGSMSSSDVAALMRYCGQSVMMDYGVDASGASSYMVGTALKKYWGADASLSFIGRGSCDEMQWMEAIYGELKGGHPVYYDAYSPSMGGHAFVVDGYKDGLFHINWGWDGNYDGYFSLENLNPTDAESPFYSQGAMVGLVSAPSVDDETRAKAVIEKISCSHGFFIISEKRDEKIKVTFDINANVREGCDMQFALGVYNDAGYLCNLAETVVSLMSAESKSKAAIHTPTSIDICCRRA